MIVILLAAIAAFVWTLLFWAVAEAGPDRVPTYAPRHAAAISARVPGATLDPVTLALPPVDCNLADDVLERIAAGLRSSTTDIMLADRPTGASGKRHDPGWQFNTDAYNELVERHFADQPQDQAVTLPWRGSGRVRVVDVTDEMYAAVTR